jgi:hypothetical protein
MRRLHMSAVKPLGTENFISATFPWSRAECTQDKIQEKVIEKFTSFIRDVEDRKSNYSSDPSKLNRGCWYPNDYFEALKVANQAPRFKFFKEQGSFFHGWPAKGFTHVANPRMPGCKQPIGYTLKERTLPTEALNSLKDSICFIDCQEAIEIAYYEVLLEAWGEEVFNKRFQHGGKTALSLNADIINTPLHLFMSEEVYQKSNEGFYCSIKKGDEVFLKNVPIYTVKHPNGEAGAFHTLCYSVGEERKFIALGLPIDGVTEDEVLGVFAKEFNRKPIENSELYSEEFIAKMLKLPQVPKEIQALAQTLVIDIDNLKKFHFQAPDQIGMMPFIRRLSAEKIQQAMNFT